MDEMNILVEEELEEQDIEVDDADEELAIDVEDEETEQDVEVVEETATWNMDYNSLLNKPSINDVELKNDKSFEDLGAHTMTNMEIKAVFDRVFGGNNNA